MTAADAGRESEESFGSSASPAAPPGLLWRTRASMPTPRLEAGAAVINGKVYVVGGFSGSALTTTEAYDPATDTWTTRADMPTARRSPVVARSISPCSTTAAPHRLPRRLSTIRWQIRGISASRRSHSGMLNTQWHHWAENYTHSPLAHSQNTPLQPTHGSFDHPLHRLSPK